MKEFICVAAVTLLGASALHAQGKRADLTPDPVIDELAIAIESDDLAPLAEEELMARLQLMPVMPEIQATPVPPAAPAAPAPGAFYMAFGKGSYLGVGVAEIDAARAKELRLPEERGVEITRVSEGSPAEKAGLKENDVVLEVNGERIQGVEQFVRMIREIPAGRQVKLVISRNGQTQTVTAAIADRAKIVSREWESKMKRDLGRLQDELSQQRFNVVIPDMPQMFTAWRTSLLGIEAEGLSGQLAEAFGVKKGVLVRSVTKDSPADKAGLKAGDVIVRVDGEEVAAPSDISSRLRKVEGVKTMAVTIMRNRAETAVQVTIEGRDRAPAAGEFGPRRIRVVPAPPPPPAPPARMVAHPYPAVPL